MKKIKVLHLTNNDVLGGAARYVMRLHESLIDNGVDSKILVLQKESDSGHVMQISRNRYLKKMSHFFDRIPTLLYKNKNKFSSGIYGKVSQGQIKNIEFDVLHIHWITDGAISIKSLKNLSSIGKPMIWSILDMWPFTGGCHYDNNCDKYSNTCGACPELSSKSNYDLSSFLLSQKMKYYSKMDFTIIAISNWLRKCILNSASMKNKDVHVIHPCVNTNLFRPVNKIHSRDLFLLPRDKKLILFGAVHSTSDPRKGYKYLLKAIKILERNASQLNKFELVVFGATTSKLLNQIKSKVHYIGRLKSGFGIHDDASLAALYSAADVTIVPSIQEAFGQLAIESMACGTPVIGFTETGLDDIINHKIDGYLAKINSPEDISNGIKWIFDHDDYSKLSISASDKIKKMFSYKKSSEQCINLYENLMEKK